MAELKSRWMVAVEVAPNLLMFRQKKTSGTAVPLWYINNKKHGDELGWVSFEPAWKEFVFCPNEMADFSAECLSDLASFLTELNKER